MSDTVVKSDSLREVFGQTLCSLADPERPNFYVLGVDLAGGVGSHWFRSKFPDRHLELGICESAAMGVAAGLAASTNLPIYLPGFATFLLRGLEPARLAIFYDFRNVKIICSHLGVSSGPDGGSVQELSYIAIWRSIPNSVVIWPADATEMRQVLKWSLEYDGPIVIFTGRNVAPPVTPPDYQFNLSTPQAIYPASPSPLTPDLTLIACGHTVSICIQAAETLGNSYGIEAQVVNMSTLKPVNREALRDLCGGKPILVCEDHSVWGGLYGAVCEMLAPYGFRQPIVGMGLTTFGESGSPEELFDKYGIGVEAVVREARELVG